MEEKDIAGQQQEETTIELCEKLVRFFENEHVSGTVALAAVETFIGHSLAIMKHRFPKYDVLQAHMEHVKGIMDAFGDEELAEITDKANGNSVRAGATESAE